MMTAYDFILDCNDKIRFDICIDNEWFNDLNRKEAFDVIKTYEENMTQSNVDMLDEKQDYYVAHVTYWSTSENDYNAIYMVVS